MWLYSLDNLSGNAVWDSVRIKHVCQIYEFIFFLLYDVPVNVYITDVCFVRRDDVIQRHSINRLPKLITMATTTIFIWNE